MWRIIEDGALPGEVNMAQDLGLLESQRGQPQPTLRLYRWVSPCMTVGATFKKVPGTIFKRPTGGGAVFHTEDLSLSVVVPRHHAWGNWSICKIYRGIHSMVQQACLGLGLPVQRYQGHAVVNGSPWCFDVPVTNDLMVGNTKVMGGAIRKTKWGWLYQGTIQLDWAQVGCAPSDLAQEIIVSFTQGHKGTRAQGHKGTRAQGHKGTSHV